ncbi:AraC family transcriptional regulator [Hyalangium versicolor]|uniref:AraC family transcriptional regulator n=1 Tax=Hyalangium versicolor TaxID=2861190 RepID=UPI001CCD205A|nr:AraC family transcriptional regulator [Hyalangium versicolor]
MARNFGNLAAGAPALPIRSSGRHLLGHDGTFCARDVVCHAGAHSPRFEGEYSHSCISVLLAGTFHTRTGLGEVLAGPGTLLLANASTAYENRHVDDGGDRSIVFDYEEAQLDEVGHSLGVRLHGARPFGRVCIPASTASADAVVLAHEALRSGDVEALREAALAVASVALIAQGGGTNAVLEPSSRQLHQVAQTVRYVEAHSDEDCSLDTLAAHAGLSSFHFLRVFRAMTGQTPRQFVIATRMRGAAIALRSTRRRITDIALDAGFGDLSHFTVSFARVFGLSPRNYRKRYGLGAQVASRSARE